MPVSNDPPETDVEKYALDLVYTRMFRQMLELQNEDANPIVLGEQAKLMGHAASGLN
jgi:hypothetical protein